MDVSVFKGTGCFLTGFHFSYGDSGARFTVGGEMRACYRGHDKENMGFRLFIRINLQTQNCNDFR